VTKGASQDGNAIVTYAADSHTLYGFLQHWPRATHPPDATREVYDWDSRVFLGVIPEANETFNVIGNVNEFGLAITESTWGGCVRACACCACSFAYAHVWDCGWRRWGVGVWLLAARPTCD
jgi:hypothetical protein